MWSETLAIGMHQLLRHLPGVAEIYSWAISDWLIALTKSMVE